MPSDPPATNGAVRRFEWWMTVNLAFGIGFNAFIPILLPAYILSVGGSPADVGVAMAMAGLFALAGPTIGGFASRYRAYRLTLALGVEGLAAGLAVLALSRGDSFFIVLAVAILGIGAAALLVVAPAFIVGTGLSREDQARQLTSLQLNIDAGKILGGALLGGLAAANASFDTRFWVGAALLAVLGAFVWATSAGAAQRLVSAGDSAGAGAPAPDVPLRSMLLSLFGLLLLAQLLATMMSSVVSSQYSNIFKSVFELSDEQVSSLVSASGFVGIGLYFVAGWWMARADSTLVWATGNALRGLGGLLLALLGAVGGVPYVAILGAYLLFESAAAFSRIAQAATAVAFAPAAAAVATGWLAASQALGQAGASLGGGLLADATGSFEVLLWVAGGLGVASATIGFIVLVPAARRREPAAVAQVPQVPHGQQDFAP